MGWGRRRVWYNGNVEPFLFRLLTTRFMFRTISDRVVWRTLLLVGGGVVVAVYFSIIAMLAELGGLTPARMLLIGGSWLLTALAAYITHRSFVVRDRRELERKLNELR